MERVTLFTTTRSLARDGDWYSNCGMYTKTKHRKGGTAALALVTTALLTGCTNQPESMVASAKEHLAKNDRAGAMIQLQNALQRNPNLGEARFLLGSTLFANGELVAAEKELRRAMELGYSYDAVAPLLTQVLVLRGDYKKAIDEFAKAEVQRPQARAALQTALGRAYLGTLELAAARERFTYASGQQPDYAEALVGLARVTAIEGNLADALVKVEAALAKSPALLEGWQLEGDLLSAQGQPDAAALAYRKALDVKPDYLQAHSSLIFLLIQQGKLEDAARQLERMQKLAPKHPQTLYLEALLAFQQRNYVVARDVIQKQLALATDNVPGLVLSARINSQLGSYDQAEAELLKVLAKLPKQQAARMILADTYTRMGLPTKAANAIKPLLEEPAPSSDVLAFAGEMYARNGEYAKAGRYFEEASKLDPKSVTKRTAVALSHLAKGEEQRGLSELEAVAAADTGIRADLALIATLARQGKFDAALNAIAALEKKQPNSAFTHTLRGEILIAKHDNPGARASFARSLSIDPNYFPATLRLAQMDVLAGKPEDAKKRFDALLAKDPRNAGALLAMAALRVRTGGTTEEVAAMIRSAIAAAKTDSDPRLALIAHYLTAGEPAKAVTAAQDAVAALPGRLELLDALGQAQQVVGDLNGAIATYTRISQLLPESPMPFVRIAELQLPANDTKGARASLQKALAITPDLLAAQQRMVALEVGADSVAAALAVARTVQKQRPTESAGYILEGDIHAEKKAWSDAAASYYAGLKLVRTPDLAVKLTAALRAGGNFAQADQFAASWLKEHPNDPVFAGYRAESLLEKKDYSGAAREYKAMLQKHPNDWAALNNLAWVSHQLKDPTALEYAEKANTLAPDNAAILDTLGELLLEKGDVKRAVEVHQRAVALAPGNAGMRLNLARALLRDGQKEAAKRQLVVLERLGDRYPDQVTVAKLKQGL